MKITLAFIKYNILILSFSLQQWFPSSLPEVLKVSTFSLNLTKKAGSFYCGFISKGGQHAQHREPEPVESIMFLATYS